MELPVNYNELDSAMRRKVREEYIRIQGARCSYCGGSLFEEPPEYIKEKPITERLYPPNFFKFPVHLHHDHSTGMTKGAVHCYCNAVLYEYEGE